MPGYGYGKMNKKTSKKSTKKKVRIVMGNKNTKAKKRKV
jgi:GTP-binding protein EngB required for normal cell division